jgi:hypothetical protein
LVPALGQHLLLADDEHGVRFWPSLAEQERARADQERTRADQERARADQLEQEVRRLRARLER